jgi:hypothetical protein
MFSFGHLVFFIDLKSQISNYKSQIDPKFQFPKRTPSDIGHWDFDNYLDSGAWNLVIVRIVNN